MSFPGTYNFNYYRGDTNEFVIRPKTSTGSTFPLDGYTAEFFIANQRGPLGTQVEAQATVNTTTDIVTCTITPNIGGTLSAGTYVYDVQITDNIVVYTLLTGTITVTEDVTGAV